MSLNKKCFAEYCQNNLVVLDGATGTNLMKAGMDMGECPERWILDHAEVMISMQVDYIKAGSNVIYAPTFTCNSIKLEEYGLEDSLADYNEKLVELSKEAIRRSGCESPIYIAADLTMTGKQIVPVGALEFEDLIQVYKEQVSVLMNTGVDLFVIETMMSLQETRAAVLAVKETCDLPIMVSMTFESDGRTLYGSDAKTCAIVLEHLGICAIGANCSTGPILMKSIIADMASVASIPILAKPNAGMPELDQDGNTIYSLGAEKFAQEMKVLINAGATIVGGCCGTTHQHIERLVEEVSKLSFHKLQVNHQVGYLTTERNTLSIGLNDPFYMIGERINPTGKKALQASLREGDLTMVESFAKEQIAKGATLLDVNLGMNGIDECAMMVQVIQELAAQVEVPLVIDSS
ncbi:MAG: homocysteine S-methyltransferase family protein, partial [Eubacteriales bacterium]